MVSVFRREMWVTKNDGFVYKIGRVPKSVLPTTDPPFVTGVTVPVYYREGGAPSDAGPFTPPIAASTDAGIAGIIPGRARTNYSSTINWSTPQTIKDKNLTGAAVQSLMSAGNGGFGGVTGADHLLSNCLITGPSSSIASTSVTGGYIDLRDTSVARFNAEFVTIRPDFPTDNIDGFYGHDYTAYRCLVERTCDGFAALNKFSANVNVTLEGCWAGHFAWYNYDRGVHTSPGTEGTHNDWLQHHSGNYVSILGCTSWGYKWNALNPLNDAAGTTPLAYGSGNSSNRWPQTGQTLLTQTAAYFHVGNVTVDGLWIYGNDTPVKPTSLCAISGHNHQWDSNPSIHNVTFLNDDQRDYGGSLHFYPIRTDTSERINSQGGWPTTGSLTTPAAWNCNYGSSSNADRKLNVSAARRGTPIFLRADLV